MHAFQIRHNPSGMEVRKHGRDKGERKLLGKADSRLSDASASAVN